MRERAVSAARDGGRGREDCPKGESREADRTTSEGNRERTLNRFSPARAIGWAILSRAADLVGGVVEPSRAGEHQTTAFRASSRVSS